MKLPLELEDSYVKEVLNNTSLQNLPGEEWQLIEGFENYTISNHGRVKSLERWVSTPNGGEQKILDRIMKPQAFRYFNKHLKAHFYNVRCNLCIEGKVYGRSIARLVYYHFVEKFDMDDLSFRISFKDENRFNVHFSNLVKLTNGEVRSKALNAGRGKKGNYYQPVSQYTVNGDFVASYENIYAAGELLEIHHTHILSVINRKGTTAGTFRWFAKDYTPSKEDFIPDTKIKPEKILNTTIWKRLGQPTIDKNNPPACMNLSLKNLSGEKWKFIPGLENQYAMSNKGRIKRLSRWTVNKNKTFWKEKIVALFLDLRPDNATYYFYTNVNYNGKRVQIRINRLLYYCFIEQFDLRDKSLVVVNRNDPAWKLDLSKLELYSSASFLKKIYKD